MQTLSVEEAKTRLDEIIDKLRPGEEVVITRNEAPVAELRSLAAPARAATRQLGALRGSILYIAPDFDAIPEGFEDYVK